MAKPQIGVVVPTLNAAATLDWTLCSLRSQRNIDLQLLVADSGSQDGTLDICRSWGVQTIYVPPGNIYRAINEGLRQMETEWVTEVDSDDLVYAHSYVRMMTFGVDQGASLVYGDCDFTDLEGRFLFTEKSPPPSRLLGMFRCGRLGFMPSAAIFRKSAFHELGGFDERYSLVADADFFSRLALSSYPLAKLPGPTVGAYRLHAVELSARQAEKMQEEKKLRRRALNVKASLGDFVDLLYWRLQNSPSRLWYLVRRGRLRMIRHLRSVGGT